MAEMTAVERSLLEQAARAIGLRIDWESTHGCYWIAPGQGWVVDPWSPLSSNADAFRLAVKLRIKFMYNDRHRRGMAWLGGQGTDVFVDLNEAGGCEEACVRLAIVRIAAHCGQLAIES